MSITTNTKNSLKERWLHECFSEHNAHYGKAIIAKDVWRFANGDDGVAYKILNSIGVMHGRTKTMCRNMNTAIQQIPDEDIWIAVGWGGVQFLIRTPKTEMKKRIRKIRAEVKKGILPKARIIKIAKGGKKPAKKKASKKPSLDEVVVLKKDLHALLKANIISRRDLSPETIKILGMGKRQKKTA